MKREVKIGLVVFLGLALLAGLIFVSGGRLVRQRGYILEVQLPEAKGLPPGAPVYISGVETGYVEDVFLTDRGVTVSVFIKEGVNIPSDSKFFVQGGGLLGEASLQIRRGSSDTFIVPPGPVKGTTTPDVWSVLEEMERNLSSLRSFIDNLSGLIGDEELEDLKRAMKRIPSFLESAEEASESLKGLSDEGKVFLGDMRGRMGTFLDNANGMVSNINEILAENRQTFKETMANASDLVARLSAMAEELDQGGPFAAEVKQLVKNASDAALAFERFVVELEKTFFSEGGDGDGKGNLPKLLEDVRQTQEAAQSALKAIQEIEVKGDVSLRGKTFGRGEDAYMDVNVALGMKNRKDFLLFGVDDLGDGSDFTLSYGYRWKWISLWGGLVRDDLGVGLGLGDPTSFPIQLIGKWWDDGSGAWSLEGRYNLNDRYGLLFRHDELDDERRESVGVYYKF